MSLLVLVPSRGRPEAAKAVLDTFSATVQASTSSILFGLDDDDPHLDEYLRLLDDDVVDIAPRRGMVGTLNRMAAVAVDQAAIIGFVGDDHRFRTMGWDRIVINALAEPGIAYGNDLLQGENLASQVFISSSIIRALGWMGLPSCLHLYIDNAWMDLGRETGTLHYLPDVTIEHLHPVAGKADWDDGYRRVNNPLVYERDRSAYHTWLAGPFEQDVRRVKAAIR